MNVYDWESNPRAHRKKVKKAGTVVLHPMEDLNTDFDRFLKPQPVMRANPFAVDAALEDLQMEEVQEPHEDTNDVPVNSDDEEEDSPKGRRKVMMPLMLSSTVQRLKKSLGFSSLLPSQAQCYKGIFLRRDVILHSRTGSGKTLAYALPIIERYLIFKEKMLSIQPDLMDELEGPFLLVFLFSVDLAVQTKSVLSSVYPHLRIEVPGYRPAAEGGEESESEKERLSKANILIGTVHAMDVVIRGHRAAARALEAEEKEAEEGARLLGKKRERGPAAASKDSTREAKEGEDSDEEAENDEEEDDEDDETAKGARGVVSAACVQAIVMDEVDSTLGPRFSSVGRRMKNLLKFIRKSNGALNPNLLTDYRAHHYVLCGATIPNWVIKAGFLGIKKYYYRLVDPGGAKLARGVECFQILCPAAERVQKAKALLLESAHANPHPSDSKKKKKQKEEKGSKEGVHLGRVVVFGNHKEVEQLGAALAECDPSILPAFTLTSRLAEAERIKAIDSFNRSTHACATLLCTDIAARGLDMVAAETILMLSLPQGAMCAETFIHRAGRTARVNRSGQCIVLVDPRRTAPKGGGRGGKLESDAELLERIVQSTHADFLDFDAVLGGKKERRVQLQLEVRRPFSGPPREGTAAVPTAKEVLERELGAAQLLSLATDIQEDPKTTERVHFYVPASELHAFKKRLWKFSLKELSRDG